jgi:hypothetical protein
LFIVQGPYLIFDKSSLESLDFDEAVMLDNFFACVITPIFFVECLADLEKKMRSNSTPEQLVGSLADRTPEDGSVTIHHLDVLRFELVGKLSMVRLKGGPFVAGGRSVQLGDNKGMLFLPTKEQEAMQRWTAREFLEAERGIAKAWRRALTTVDFDALVKEVMAELGPHWRKPKTLQDAREMADVIIDHMDPQWLLGFGIEMLGVGEVREQAIADWIAQRRPSLRERFPYFVFMLSINIFFCLVLPTQLLSRVKASHHIDLAYLYYLPFCSVFTSKDNFHVQIVPLFLRPDQTFVNGIDLKDDMRKLVERYLALDEAEFNLGMDHYAKYPPDDTCFLTTQLWDKYTPKWRNAPPPVKLNEQLQRALMEAVNKLSESADVPPHNLGSVGELGYVSREHKIHLRRGKWRRYSQEMEQRIIDSEKG